ncbi:hypothetical protein [Microlunatus sp. Gsoil 973]|uniref:hypothetical protein n=1 Tax=Microlunatus sp. Gsoil 973 TaxID=2672569 RepID=UPI0012B4DB9C|nr:hypothetical protein [Microlunatus sp. Gsoil 973]QGN33621.1 hypothetical protein GJV80_13290 [Microlunatus sp. Gsoil 973]
MSRRTLLAGGVTAVALPTIIGCTPDGSMTPQITRKEVQAVQDRYAHRLFAATRTRDRELLRTIEGGPLLDRDLATIDLADRLRAPKTAEEYTLPNSTGYPVRSTTGNDQQQLITVADYSSTQRDWRDLALYRRNGPAGEWLRVYGAGLHSAAVPNFDHDRPLSPLAPDVAGYPAIPNAIPSLVANALADPGSAQGRMFDDSDIRHRYAMTLAATREHAASVGTVTRSYRPGPLVIAIAVEVGYLALGCFDYDETLTARHGRHITFARRSPQHTAYPGTYHTTTATYGAMFAAVVPKRGRVRMISGEQRQTDLTAD